MKQSYSDALYDYFITIASSTIIFIILGIIALFVAIAYVIRLWLVQTATFKIQKDVADIRDHILGLDIEDSVSKPAQHIKKGYVEPLAIRKKIEFKRPRQVFLWLTILIPVLLLFLIIALTLF